MPEPAPAAAIGASLAGPSTVLADQVDRLQTLGAGLIRADGYYVDHADEHLEWVIDALRATASTLENLRGYTTVGAARRG